MKRGIGRIKFAEFDINRDGEGLPSKKIVVATEENVIAVLNSRDGKNVENVW